MSFLLLETGDHMLQETGDALLLDEATSVTGAMAVFLLVAGVG